MSGPTSNERAFATLIAIDDLPKTPVVINSARSYRQNDHAPFGNRIVALHPHLATHLADPIARLRAIHASMPQELARTHLDEAMLDAPERPFGPRDRRTKFAERAENGARSLPGNVTLSCLDGAPRARVNHVTDVISGAVMSSACLMRIWSTGPDDCPLAVRVPHHRIALLRADSIPGYTSLISVSHITA